MFRSNLISVIFYGHTQDAMCLVAGDLVHLCIKSRILDKKKVLDTKAVISALQFCS